MNQITEHSIKGWFVAACLAGQLVVLWISLDAYMAISIFCTGPASSGLGKLFGLTHLFLLALFLFGSLALAISRLRRFYLILLGVGLILLPVQAILVENDRLSCDGP